MNKELEELGFDRVRIGDKTYAILGFVKEKGKIKFLRLQKGSEDVFLTSYPISMYDEIEFYNSEKSPVKNKKTDFTDHYINWFNQKKK